MNTRLIVTVIALSILCCFAGPAAGASDFEQQALIEQHIALFFELHEMHRLLNRQAGRTETAKIDQRLAEIFDRERDALSAPESRDALRSVFSLLPEAVAGPAGEVLSSLESGIDRDTLLKDIRGLFGIVACLGFLIPAFVLFVVGVALIPLIIPPLVLLPLAGIFYVLYLTCMIIF